MRKRLLGLALLAASGAAAQCVMCARTAAAQNAARVEVLEQGVLVLLIPPVLIMGFFVSLAWRRRS